MTDKYDVPFDMTEYPAVRAAFDALPAAQLPAGLSASALFAQLDAQAQEPACAPKAAQTFDIRQLRRGMAIAACCVLVVAAYVGLSQAGLLGGATANTAAAPQAAAAASTAAVAADPESAEESMLFSMQAEGAYDAAYDAAAPEAAGEPVAEGAANDAVLPNDAKQSAAGSDELPPQEDDLLAVVSPDAGNALPANPDTAGEPLSGYVPEGYTLLADASQQPEAVLEAQTGIPFVQLRTAALAGLDSGIDFQLSSIAAADNGDGSYALELLILAPVYSGDPLSPSGSNYYRLLPAGDGYDLCYSSGAFIAHLTAG